MVACTSTAWQLHGTAEAVPFQSRSIAIRQYPKQLASRQPIHRKIALIEGEDGVQAIAGGEVDEGGVGELDADVAVLFQDGGDGLSVGGG